MDKALISARETAAYLGCSEAAIRRWVARGRLRGVRVGRALRIDRKELDGIVARGSLDGQTVAPLSSRAPLPWALRKAEDFLDALDHDVDLARACLDVLGSRP